LGLAQGFLPFCLEAFPNPPDWVGYLFNNLLRHLLLFFELSYIHWYDYLTSVSPSLDSKLREKWLCAHSYSSPGLHTWHSTQCGEGAQNILSQCDT
jgi:hypothetical protein